MSQAIQLKTIQVTPAQDALLHFLAHDEVGAIHDALNQIMHIAVINPDIELQDAGKNYYLSTYNLTTLLLKIKQEKID